MTDREKLAKLQYEATHDCRTGECRFCAYNECDDCTTERMADHLIANGVTFAKDTDAPTKKQMVPLDDVYRLIAGHSDYHGGFILSALTCVAEGKEVKPIKPIEMNTDKWISVKERLPESEKIVLVSAVSKQFGYRHTLMAAHIGHHEATTEDWREYEGDTEYDEENDCFWIPECWWESNAIEDNGNWIIDGEYDVTHWMPLPSLPKEECL